LFTFAAAKTGSVLAVRSSARLDTSLVFSNALECRVELVILKLNNHPRLLWAMVSFIALAQASPTDRVGFPKD
jgi:hypothetical protein